ncbi:30S ribosomal protein S16 [Candidatus Kinetoplastidibacterium galati]|uniref:Small ribosomal subunit protein bS16 n=1 Tax=Candidatus Kinetoplastidibacterium galati TCC219 TaxID=1208921 RepID=M1LU70_9PROT|nr:30S ribosomal protein S16 [Candidatus Kinetoplastibacterium galatii]AGF49102.1 small subunit ribosomal protein S16 [Candidatus Kinetoplastibacterium galatii TCC219]
MVIIRLARGGSKKRPFYSLVVTDSRNRRDGRFIERLGFYNPVSSSIENKLKVSLDRVEFWKNNGACLSPVVERLVSEYSKNINCA